MSRYRKIDQRIWNDQKFRSLGDSAKLTFFMLLTHPSMTMLGAMRATVSGLAEELAWTPEAFREAFAEVLQQGMAEHDLKAHLIALPNFLKYNKPESPNVVKAWTSALDLLPECSLKTRVVVRCKAFAEGMSDGFREALPEAFAMAMPYQEPEPEPEPEQEQEQEQEQNYSAPNGAGGEPPLVPALGERWPKTDNLPPPAPPPPQRGSGNKTPKEKTAAEQEKSALWAALKTLLVEQKAAKSIKDAGMLAGKLASQYGAEVFVDAVRETVRLTPTDAHTYLIGLCQIAAGKRIPLGKPGAMTDEQRAAAGAASTAEALKLLGYADTGKGEVVDEAE